MAKENKYNNGVLQFLFGVIYLGLELFAVCLIISFIQIFLAISVRMYNDRQFDRPNPDLPRILASSLDKTSEEL